MILLPWCIEGNPAGRRMRDPKFTLKSGAIIPEMEMQREAEAK